MKKIYKTVQVKLTALLLLLFSISGCDSYLDEAPDNRQELKTLEDLSELLVSAYSEATYNFVEFKTDNAEAVLGNIQKKWLTENFTYTPVTSNEGQETPTYLWDKNYFAIAHANQALAKLEEFSFDDKNRVNAIKGEALLTRAYNHFILASVFCQAYEPTTADSNLGIPYIVEPETELEVDYERGTLKETYDLIQKDLLEGISLISDEYYKGLGKYHFSKGAAYAFASRFFLFKQDYKKCIKYSNMLLGDGIVGINYCRDMKETFTGTNPEEIANKFINPELPSNLLLVRKETLSGLLRIYYGYQSTKAIFSAIYNNSIQGGKDYRDSQWGFSNRGCFAPPKYAEFFRYITATTGYPYFVMPEFRSEEVLLNRMEAYVKDGRVNDALSDYNVFAPTRYQNGGHLEIAQIVKFYNGTEQEAMFKFIIDERRKEFLREGIRWWDIKRFKIKVTHKDLEGKVFELMPEDFRKAVQIPAKAIANGIQENPR